jgi:hypothetical protein
MNSAHLPDIPFARATGKNNPLPIDPDVSGDKLYLHRLYPFCTQAPAWVVLSLFD